MKVDKNRILIDQMANCTKLDPIWGKFFPSYCLTSLCQTLPKNACFYFYLATFLFCPLCLVSFDPTHESSSVKTDKTFDAPCTNSSKMTWILAMIRILGNVNKSFIRDAISSSRSISSVSEDFFSTGALRNHGVAELPVNASSESSSMLQFISLIVIGLPSVMLSSSKLERMSSALSFALIIAFSLAIFRYSVSLLVSYIGAS